MATRVVNCKYPLFFINCVYLCSRDLKQQSASQEVKNDWERNSACHPQCYRDNWTYHAPQGASQVQATADTTVQEQAPQKRSKRVRVAIHSLTNVLLRFCITKLQLLGHHPYWNYIRVTGQGAGLIYSSFTTASISLFLPWLFPLRQYLDCKPLGTAASFLIMSNASCA